jgi:phage terminase small subunit
MASKKSKPPAVSSRHMRFIEEYFACGMNATKAYCRVYPNSSAVAARASATDILALPSVSKIVRQQKADLRKRAGVETDQVIAEWAKIAFADLGDVFDFSGKVPALRKANTIPPEARQAIQSLNTQTRTTRKTRTFRRKALEGEEADDKGMTTVREEAVTTRTTARVKLEPKIKALENLTLILGLREELPDLESLLARLPRSVADRLRQLLAASVPPRTGELVGVVPHPVAGGDVPGDAADPGPVATKLPAGVKLTPDDPGMSTGGEDEQHGGESPSPLFDDP